MEQLQELKHCIPLAGISPTGTFKFVSQLWSGGASDSYITMKLDLADKLEPNDDCMVDGVSISGI